jgi:hypothetical protein
MSGYRKEWPCCGDETYTEAWEPERCPFCELNDAQNRIAELETELEAARAQQSGEGRIAIPRDVAEAHGMYLIGYSWLKHNAPNEINLPARKPQGEWVSFELGRPTGEVVWY